MDYLQYQKSDRWLDFFKAADDCAKLIVKEKPDFVIHCGDLFHQFKPSPGALRLTIQILEKFKQNNIPFIIIRGNHDASKAQVERYGGTILRLLDELGYLRYVQDETIAINSNITFTGIGEYGRATGQVLEEIIRNNPIDPLKFNILALHGYLQGQISDSVYDLTGYQLANIGFNYIAIGHYHKIWDEVQNNIYCSGSTEQTSLNDWGKPEKDGFIRKSGFNKIIIKFNPESQKWEKNVKRIEFEIRPKGRFKYEFNNKPSAETILEQANNFVKKHDLEKAIIRYDFIGNLPIGKQSLINFSNLPAIKESKALHIMVNQQISSITLQKGNLTSDYQDAILELLNVNYNIKDKKEVSQWYNLILDILKLLGNKTIPSEDSEEIKLSFQLISELSKAKCELKAEKTISNNKNTEKLIEIETKKKQSKLDGKQQATKSNSENKNVKQSDLSSFFGKGEE